MKLTESMPVQYGDLFGTIYGGRFKSYEPGTRRLIGIKMAEEIDHPSDVRVDTTDFSVPTVEDMRHGMVAALDAMAAGKDVYVGCMGGTGRTGTFMGCMAKLMMDYDTEYPMKDPVLYVRHFYRKHAIETAEQERYVRTFDTGPVLEHLTQIENRRLVHIEVPVEKIVERVVERTVYLGPVEWAAYQWNQFWGKKP